MDQSKGRRRELLQTFDRLTELPMLVLALLFIPVLLVPVLFRLTPAQATSFFVADSTIWAMFGMELLVKTYLAEHRIRYLRDHWFDVLIVAVPFARPLRIARSVRALRGLRAFRLANIAARSANSLRVVLSQHGLHYALAVSAILIAAGAGAETLFERGHGGNIENFGDALWWAMATVTTVGYGDKYPVTPEGRGIAIFLMLLGISLLSLITANLAAFLANQTRRNQPSLDDVLAQLHRLEELILAQSQPTAP